MSQSKLMTTAIHYSLQLFIIECVLFAGFLLLAPPATQIPSVVGAGVTFCFYLLSGWVWYWVASHHRDFLTSFYTGASGFRFLLTLIVLAVYYLTTERSAMLTFIWVYAIYYLITLVHSSIFFSRVSNRL